MSGPRYQFAPGDIRPTEDPLEGEPRWDAIKRRVGFFNFERGVIEWFRIPGEGENENYVPQHGWDGSSLRFKNPDGTWGEYVNVGLIGVELSNSSGTTKMIFKTAAGTFEAPVEVKLLDDDPNNPLNQSLMALYFQLDKLVELHDSLPKIDIVYSNGASIYDVANKIAEVNRVAMSIDAVDDVSGSLPALLDVAANKDLIINAASEAAGSALASFNSAEDAATSLIQTSNIRADVELIRNTLLDGITAEAERVDYDQSINVYYDGQSRILKFMIPDAHVTEFSYNDLDDKPDIPQGTVKRVIVPNNMSSALVDPNVGDATLSFNTGFDLITKAQTDKLAAIAEQATKNQTDSFLINRSNHTGTQAIATISSLQATLDDIDGRAEQKAMKGQANGYASLDANGFVPLSELNEAILGGMNYKGVWDASTNTPPIPPAAPENKGWYYVVEVPGNTNIDGNSEWAVGDWIVSNGTEWDKLDSSDQVTSVNGQTGAVFLDLGELAALNKINNSHWEGVQLSVVNGGTGSTTIQGVRDTFSLYSKAETDTRLDTKWTYGTELSITGRFTGGAGFKISNQVASSISDLSRHLDIGYTTYGLNVTSNTLNIVSQNTTRFVNNGVDRGNVDASGNLTMSGDVRANSGNVYAGSSGGTFLQMRFDGVFLANGTSLLGMNTGGLTMYQGILYPTQQNNNVNTGDGSGSIQIRNNGGTGDNGVASISFHCTGAYAMKMHLRSDGVFGIGGWSSSVWRWYSNPNGDMVAAGNVSAYSDPRLKEHVSVIEGALAIVSKLDGVRFQWNSKSSLNKGKHWKWDIGVLADQVKAVFPEIVTPSISDEKNGGIQWDTVDYGKLVPVLIEAIKELKAEVDTLKKRLN